MPLLSIIIPAYNADRFIANTLNMLVSQGLDNCEVIVINDGSTDKTAEIIREFADKNDSIKIISIPNSGVSAARNTGIQYARGEYIYFFDSDDTLITNSITSFKSIITTTQRTDMVVFGYESRVNNKLRRKYLYQKYNNCYFKNTSEFFILYLSKKVMFSVCCLLLKREFILKNALLFSNGVRVGEDVEFIINAILYAKTIYYDASIYFVYQIRDDSAMQGYKKYSIDQFNVIALIGKHTRKITNIHGDTLRYINFFLANLYMYNLILYLRSNQKDNDINRLFMDNKKLLFMKIHGSLPRQLLLYGFRIVSIKLLFFIFHKNVKQDTKKC
jgi:glycosyltransferase involved in cell wall biosynthesis